MKTPGFTLVPLPLKPTVSVQEVGLWECQRCGTENIETGLFHLRKGKTLTCSNCKKRHRVGQVWMEG